MNTSKIPEQKKFEHPIYCSTIISNNACIYEINKLLKNKDIYFDFPYNKQLFYITSISSGKSVYVNNINEVKEYFEERQTLSKTYPQQPSNPASVQKDYNAHFKQMNQDKTQWQKIILDYYIIENGKKIFLKNLPVIRSNDIFDHIKRTQSTKASSTKDQSQTEEPDGQIKGNKDVEILDGIYYFIDFLDKNKNKQSEDQGQSKKMEQYVEKIFDQFNKSVIYSFLSYFVSSCISKMINRNLYIDVDIRNFILIREGSSIKFAYLVTYEDFKIELEEQLCKSIESFNYESFCLEYYHINKNNQMEITNKNKMEFNAKFQNKYQQFLKLIADSLLNEQDKKEAINDSQFAKDCLEGVNNIEEVLKAQDQRKRFCKMLINKNQILTALQNQEALQIFKILYKQEKQQIQASAINQFEQRDALTKENGVYVTQSEILNSFLQDCLKRSNYNPDYKPAPQNESDRDSIIEYICEEYPKQQNGLIVQNNQVVTTREKSYTPLFLNENQQEHEIKALSQQKREMQIQLKIKESKVPYLSENQYKRQQEEIKQRGNNPQIQEELKKLETQYNNQNQTTIRGGEKKVMIDFKEMTCSIQIKLYFSSELFILYENVDEMLYCIQILNTSFDDVSIYMDDNKRIYFQTYVSIGQRDQVLLRLIYMIDSTISYAFTFFDFYYLNMQNSKSSRDINKYIQLQQEMQQYMQSYKYKFDDFVKQIDQDL